MQILLDGKRRAFRWKGGGRTGAALLRELGISPQEALLKVDGAVRPEGTAIGPKSRIEIIRVVFGG